jgi:allantoin racemase
MTLAPAHEPLRRIALINPNTSAATTARMVEIARGAAGPGVEIVGLTAPFGAPLITTPDALSTAGDAVLSIPDAAFDDVSGVIVAAFGDPGADGLARRLHVPVIGIAEASMRAAADVGRFSVVTTTPLLADTIRQRAAILGLGDHLASVRTSVDDPAKLMSDETALRAALAALIDVAVTEDGARAIIIGGGPLAVVARALAACAPVPLIEPVPIATRAIIERLALSHRA